MRSFNLQEGPVVGFQQFPKLVKQVLQHLGIDGHRSFVASASDSEMGAFLKLKRSTQVRSLKLGETPGMREFEREQVG